MVGYESGMQLEIVNININLITTTETHAGFSEPQFADTKRTTPPVFAPLIRY